MAARRLRVVEKLEASDTNVRGDPARLQQVFWNLLTNATKFSPEDGVVEVRTFFTEGARRIGIEIADQGVGIAPEKLERIFDAFEQSARNSHVGLGLGLAICKALVEMHGGEITARSDGLNCGASFAIHLPCAAIAAEPNATRPDQISPPAGLRLLVVEDHRDTLDTLERLLKRRGYAVRTASTIAQALEVAADYEFDVLISDIGLPDGRGTELLERLQAHFGHSFPAVAMSGFGMEDDLQRSHDAGFAEHLTKPVDFAALQQAIARLAGTHPSAVKSSA